MIRELCTAYCKRCASYLAGVQEYLSQLAGVPTVSLHVYLAGVSKTSGEDYRPRIVLGSDVVLCSVQGDYNATTLRLIDQHHALGFGGGYPVQVYAANPLVCRRIGDPDAHRAQEMIDGTAAMRGITSLFYHRLADELREAFEQTIAHLHDVESAGELESIMPVDPEQELQF